jgi:carboxyl-terminal processing protease
MTVSRRIVFALACGTVLGVAIPFAQRGIGDADAPLPLQELHSFTQALDVIGTRYVDPIAPDKLIESALRGMVDGLEPHSRYLDKTEYTDWNVNTTGKYAGVGIEVEVRGGFLRVVSAMDHTPAAAAGIQPGDIIAFINGKPTNGLALKDAVERMRGEAGSRIRLGLMRGDPAKAIDVELKREMVKVSSVRSVMLEPGIGYLRITNFAADTGDAVTEELGKLQKQAGGDLHGLILDLRNNPGGVVTSAVKASDDFLEEGKIVVQRGRAPGANHEYDATPGDLLKGRPMVAMVNGGTASAAEILAGALQDHRRAVLVGSGTFGKGLVQSVTPLPAGGALVLTIARYYTPSGRSIQGLGIAPDVEVAESREDEIHYLPDREADLNHALKNEGGSGPTKPPAPRNDIPPQAKDIPAKPPANWPKFDLANPGTDFQLQQGIALVHDMAQQRHAAR